MRASEGEYHRISVCMKCVCVYVYPCASSVCEGMCIYVCVRVCVADHLRVCHATELRGEKVLLGDTC